MFSTNTDGSNMILLNYFIGSGSILISKVKTFLNHINLRKSIDPCRLKLSNKLSLHLIALLTNPIFLVILSNILNRFTLTTFHLGLLLHYF